MRDEAASGRFNKLRATSEMGSASPSVFGVRITFKSRVGCVSKTSVFETLFRPPSKPSFFHVPPSQKCISKSPFHILTSNMGFDTI